MEKDYLASVVGATVCKCSTVVAMVFKAYTLDRITKPWQGLGIIHDFVLKAFGIYWSVCHPIYAFMARSYYLLRVSASIGYLYLVYHILWFTNVLVKQMQQRTADTNLCNRHPIVYLKHRYTVIWQQIHLFLVLYWTRFYKKKYFNGMISGRISVGHRVNPVRSLRLLHSWLRSYHLSCRYSPHPRHYAVICPLHIIVSDWITATQLMGPLERSSDQKTLANFNSLLAFPNDWYNMVEYWRDIFCLACSELW
jgi:hypothetical protein